MLSIRGLSRSSVSHADLFRKRKPAHRSTNYNISVSIIHLSEHSNGVLMLQYVSVLDSGVERKYLFGGGNIPEAFVKFPEQHVCNLFCTWYDLKPLKKVVVPTKHVE